MTLHADLLHAVGRTAEAGAVRRMLRTGDPTEVRHMMFPHLQPPPTGQT